MTAVVSRGLRDNRQLCLKKGRTVPDGNDVTLELRPRSVRLAGKEADCVFDTFGHDDIDDFVYQSSSSFSVSTPSSSCDVRSPKEETDKEDDDGYRLKRDFNYHRRYRANREEGRRRNFLTRKFSKADGDQEATFRFPTLNLGICVFRKNRSRLRRNGPVENGSTARLLNDRSSRLVAASRRSLCDNRNCTETSSTEKILVQGTLVCRKNPSLFSRLNNCLRGHRMASPVVCDENTENGGAHYPRRDIGHAGKNTAPKGVGPSLKEVCSPSFSQTKVRSVETMDRKDCGSSVSNDPCSQSATCLLPIDSGIQHCTSVPKKYTKYKLVVEGQIQVCRVNHPRNFLGKLSSSKLLRRWEVHTLVLDSSEIYSKTPFGFLDHPIKYGTIEDVQPLAQWDSSGEKYCLRVFVPEGSILLQTNRLYNLNQWFYSIQWKRSVFRCRRVIESTYSHPETILKELNCVIEQARSTPLQGDNLISVSVQLVCLVLQQISAGKRPGWMMEPLLTCVAPVLDRITVVADISYWLSKHCRQNPRSLIIEEFFADVAILTLKKNMDFGKYVSTRIFLQDFLFALSIQNDGCERVKTFVRNAHGVASGCPHPRMLPNLVSVCLAAIQTLDCGSDEDRCSSRFEQMAGNCGTLRTTPLGETSSPSTAPADGLANGTIGSTASSFITCDQTIRNCALHEDIDKHLSCISAVLETMSEFEDWRLPLASMLQSVPFPEKVLLRVSFMIPFSRLLGRVGADSRCEVHQAVLAIREGKEGWLDLTCPGGPACVDDGYLFASLLRTLLHCCCRRKKFLQSLNVMLGPLQLLALREYESAIEALSNMLEFDTVEGREMKMQIITTLQSTPKGKLNYFTLRDRQLALRELQQKGGPRKLTLPSKSTDADLAVLFASGSFGNLEWLSLAFTNVTSACAEYLTKLPSLRYLNLWSTQFGDVGVQLISEHLHKLQVLNLCETPVTDKGLRCLSALTSLRKLNLNSTQLSANTFQLLRAKLPALQEVDVRYTEAWCIEDFLTCP